MSLQIIKIIFFKGKVPQGNAHSVKLHTITIYICILFIRAYFLVCISNLFDRYSYDDTNTEVTGFAPNSLHEYLKETIPSYIKVVPTHWLELEKPDHDIQIYMSILFLLIGITGNVSQLLVIFAYAR